jgi:excisionase family DNA binding protein
MIVAAPTTRAYLSVQDVASELGIRLGHVLRWIRSGELPAANVALRATGRPRWRISRHALDTFLLARQPTPPAPRTPRRRRPPANIIEFYK